VSLNKRCAKNYLKVFQRSEFLQEHGAIDMIIDRREMRDKCASILAMLMASKSLSTESELMAVAIERD